MKNSKSLPEIKKEELVRYFDVLRIILGLLFLWSFIDKVFGLGFSTLPENAWIRGVSPTTGFLQFGVDGVLKSVFMGLAGSPIVDWLFMLGLLGVGISFTFGMLVVYGGYAGAMMMLLIYLAMFPPEHHPFVDEHLIYILLFMMIAKIEKARK